MIKRINFKNLSQFLIIFIFGSYNAWLYTTNKLGFYINPRYNWLSIAAAIVALVFGCVGIVVSLRLNKIKPSRYNLTRWLKHYAFWDLCILAILTAGLILPPTQLSSATALQRTNDSNPLLSGSSSSIQNVISFNVDYTKLTIGDWVSLMYANPDIEKYENKPVHISGFVYHNPNDSDHYFSIARFRITCCAVDATPVSLTVNSKLPDGIKDNDWMDLTGHFVIAENKDEEINVIIPDKMQKIAQPDNPYIY